MATRRLKDRAAADAYYEAERQAAEESERGENDRLPDDPGMSVREDGPDHVEVTVGNHMMRMSRFNARRVLGALSIILELPLTKTAAKSIKM